MTFRKSTQIHSAKNFDIFSGWATFSILRALNKLRLLKDLSSDESVECFSNFYLVSDSVRPMHKAFISRHACLYC